MLVDHGQKDLGPSVLGCAPEREQNPKWTCRIWEAHFPEPQEALRLTFQTESHREVVSPQRREKGIRSVEADTAWYGLAGWFTGTQGQYKSREILYAQSWWTLCLHTNQKTSALPHLHVVGSPPELDNQRKRGQTLHSWDEDQDTLMGWETVVEVQLHSGKQKSLCFFLN